MKTIGGTKFKLTLGRQPNTASRAMSRTVALLAATVLAAGMLSSTPIAAFADSSTGSISGTVTSTEMVGISGVSVTASGPSYVFATTNAAGQYTLAGLSAGDYRVEFRPSWNQNFVAQYWSNSSSYNSATIISVASGSTTTGIDAALVLGATISGNVKGAGTPPINLANVRVYAIPDSGQGLSASTDSNGNFTIVGLPSGDYQLTYDTQQARGFAPEVGEGVVSLSQGEVVSGIQATLSAGSKISGRVVTESNPLVGIEGVRVSVERMSPSAATYYSGPNDRTDASGEYSLEGLPSDTFKLTFWAPNDPHLNVLNDSVQLAVSPDSVITHNAVLKVGGSVTGNVTVSGVPVQGIQVFIQDATHQLWSSAVTDNLGDYTLDQLPTGAYPVRFSDADNSSPSALATEWWPDSPTKAGASSVAVVAGEVTSGINADLSAGSSISGEVAFESGNLSATSVLYIWDADGNVFRGDWEDQYLDTNRSFLVGGLPVGNYKVGVTDKTFGDGTPSGASDSFDEFGNLVGWMFNPGYANEKESLTSADAITISGPNEHLTGQNISLTTKAASTPFSVEPVPTIGGIPEVGQVLTTSLSSTDWVPEAVDWHTRWLRDGNPISFATSSSYEVQPADAGHQLSVAITAFRIGYEEVARTSASVLIPGGLDFVTTPPSIDGTPQVGKTLMAIAEPWTPQPTELSYQWLSGATEIDGATDSTYDVTSADLGAKLSVRLTGTKDGYAAASDTSAQTAAIAGGILTTTVPTFATTAPDVGDVLTAHPGTWGPAPVALSYQWERDGEDISGAVGSNYPVIPADLGTKLSVRVVGVKAGYVAGIETSASSEMVGVGAITKGTVSITGTPEVGTELTAEAGIWSPANTTYSYVWQANGTPIPGATLSTFTPTPSQGTKTLSVVVTGTADGYATASQTSFGVVVAQEPLVAVTPTISGTPQVGEPLSANPGDWGPSGVTLGYQWAVEGVDVNGATSSSYVAVAADAWKTVTVTVTGALDTYVPVAKTSAATALVEPAPIIGGIPTVSGIVKVGETLTANSNSSGWSPSSGLAFTYQWSVNGSEVSGATNQTYVLTAEDADKTVTVTVSGAKLGHVTGSATSVATAPVVYEPLFADVDESHPFFTEIQWMLESGISTGTANPPGKPMYKSSDNVSRQAMAAFLYRLSGETFTAPAEATFADAPTTATFYTAIEWMAHEGISTGTAQPSGKPLFKPSDPVSRMAMAAFLYRYSGATEGAPAVSPFADVKIESTFFTEIAWMNSTGLSTGYANGSDLPLYQSENSVTRQAMAAFLYRMEHD